MKKAMRTKRVVVIFLLINCLAYSGANAQKSNLTLFAHRGFMGIHPENTIEGMKRALHYQSVVLEMDLAITADKQVVVSHDAVLNRNITLDSSGAELPEGKKIVIYGTKYSDLKKYDIGTKPNARFPKQMRYKAYIPRFADLIDSVEEYAAKEGLKKPMYFIEAKTNAKNDGKYHPGPEEFVDLMLEVIYKKGIQGRVIVQSFDFRPLQFVRKKHPELPVAYLPTTSLEEGIKLLGFAPDYYDVGKTPVTKEYMKKLKKLNVKPVSWFTDYEDFLRLKKLGVKDFFSNYPLEYVKEGKDKE